MKIKMIEKNGRNSTGTVKSCIKRDSIVFHHPHEMMSTPCGTFNRMMTGAETAQCKIYGEYW